MRAAIIKQIGSRYALVMPDGTFLKMFDFVTLALMYCYERSIQVEWSQK